jgi:hypothetical protein
MFTRRRVVVACLGAATLFAAAQFFQPPIPQPQPAQDKPAWDNPALDRRVAAILKRSCADCHSNETRWPWYARISPGSWFMATHVVRGRHHMNLSRQWEISEETLGEIHDAIRDGTMPLASYLWLHRDAKLSAAEQKLVKDWALGQLQ